MPLALRDVARTSTMPRSRAPCCFRSESAWLSPACYRELFEQFEVLGQHRQARRHGFEYAVAEMATVEQSFGLADLAALATSAPPEHSGG
ncbi:MAG TPA: hypothetical protein VLZ32_13225 [Rhodanobacter sp.]|nr:hypothetical protein [Rhodanobacter sp.]